jgi:hypothetical protein
VSTAKIYIELFLVFCMEDSVKFDVSTDESEDYFLLSKQHASANAFDKQKWKTLQFPQRKEIPPKIDEGWEEILNSFNRMKEHAMHRY